MLIDSTHFITIPFRSYTLIDIKQAMEYINEGPDSVEIGGLSFIDLRPLGVCPFLSELAQHRRKPILGVADEDSDGSQALSLYGFTAEVVDGLRDDLRWAIPQGLLQEWEMPIVSRGYLPANLDF